MGTLHRLVTIDQARAIVRGAGTPLTRLERVPLYEAHQRVLAQDVVSTGDVPPFARAAMDGYAVRAADTVEARANHPVRLRIVETVHTGQAPGVPLRPGHCTQIATGAPLPPGADAVVMVEDTTPADGDAVDILRRVEPGQHVGPRGGDIQAGQAVLAARDLLTTSRIGAVAAIGRTEVDVFVRPRVAILSTGDEIVEPGRPLAPGQIHDVNRYTLASLVVDHGGVPVPYGTVRDNLGDLTSRLETALSEDLVVLSGGSSVGEHDLVADLVSARGQIHFHGVAVKPGKPTLFGTVAGKPVFGLSGYPTSCLVNAYVLVVPVLRRIAHLGPHEPRRIWAALARPVTSAPGRHQFVTVRVSDGLAHPTFKSSGDITSMSLADGYVEIPAGMEHVDKGERVEVVLF